MSPGPQASTLLASLHIQDKLAHIPHLPCSKLHDLIAHPNKNKCINKRVEKCSSDTSATSVNANQARMRTCHFKTSHLMEYILLAEAMNDILKDRLPQDGYCPFDMLSCFDKGCPDTLGASAMGIGVDAARSGRSRPKGMAAP